MRLSKVEITASVCFLTYLRTGFDVGMMPPLTGTLGGEFQQIVIDNLIPGMPYLVEISPIPGVNISRSRHFVDQSAQFWTRSCYEDCGGR